MVYIKKVEIYGFKSFGYKNTVVNMENGMVCVTGPNGSGKSNILDAIMFALGENSPKFMRVDKLQSLFHDTGQQEKVHKVVRSSVTFDNSERGIPIDSNTVTITREMPAEGESAYYLNGKKSTRTAITDLLEIVLAAPNKLNVVQQGMIMRIAELNSEERRKIIEDIMGLSYFDEKKEEAMDQLEEADQKLEVAMARMGEIRKRIDDLEHERNDQLRFQYLENDIRRFKAIKVSNSITEARSRLKAQEDVLAQKLAEADALGRELEQVRTELAALEGEKDKFLQEVDVASRSKAEVNTGISNIIVRAEQLRAVISAGEQRIKVIGRSIPEMMKERDELRRKTLEVGAKVNEMNTHLAATSEEQKRRVAAELEVLNNEIAKMAGRQSSVTEEVMSLEQQLRGADESNASIMLEAASKEQHAKTLAEKIGANTSRLEKMKLERTKLQSILAKLHDLMQEERAESDSLGDNINKLHAAKSRIEREIDSSAAMLEKAGKVATQYETRIKVAKDTRHEDYSASVLLARAKELEILGTVQKLLSWKTEYGRAVMAVASPWLKSLVVKDVNRMLRLLEHARKQNLPRLRIVPLDMLMPDQTTQEMPAADGVIGPLSDFVTSATAPDLVQFLFGSTILVQSADAAYELARKGYRTVTLAGELFEPKVSAVVLDTNTKLTDLTKTILLGESVEGLKGTLQMLGQLIAKKKEDLKQLEARTRQSEDSRVSSQTTVTSMQAQIENVEASLQRFTSTAQEIENRLRELEAERTQVSNELQKLEEKRAEAEARTKEISGKLAAIDRQGVAKAIDSANLQKVQLTSTLEQIENEIRGRFTVISSHKAEADGFLKRAMEMEAELSRLKTEAKEKTRLMQESGKELKTLELELKGFRDREQQVIDTSANSVGILQEYESKIKTVADADRKLTRQLASVEKDVAIIRKDVADLTTAETKLRAELSEYGYGEVLEGFDVEVAVTELVKEYNDIRGSINQLADKTYVQVIDGYRGMSARKNQLESERTSVVRFIEDIEREKKQIFMEAFQRVDKDVRHIFSTMTDSTGSSWLEIENPDNVFASGLAFLAQFPDKPPRESTSLSGGEKTIAATTFLLALQSLKPSPFYLLDEVDAHLDAMNTERLAKVIIEKSKVSQMIVVTLKDAIVSSAQLVHGVYPRNGVSQVIKYRANAPLPTS